MISFQIFSLRFLLHGWIDSCISCPNHLCKSWLTNLCFGSLDSEMLHVMGKRYLGVRRTYILRCAIVPLIFSDILGTIWHYHELIFGLTNAKSPMKRSRFLRRPKRARSGASMDVSCPSSKFKTQCSSFMKNVTYLEKTRIGINENVRKWGKFIFLH